MHGDCFPDLDVVVVGGGAAAAGSIESVLAVAYPAESLQIFAVGKGAGAAAHSFAQVRFLETQRPAARGGAYDQGWRAGSAAFVQFVDGVSVLDGRWLRTAVRTLQDDPDLAAVFGRRAQVSTQTRVFDWIAELEQNPPAGEVCSFGPEVLIRRKALEEAGGYAPWLRNGEALDLSLRMVSRGWRIRCLDFPMTRSIAPCGLWRYIRSGYGRGYAFAALTILFGGRGGYWVECVRILVRGCIAPACVLAGQLAPVSIFTGWVLSLAGLAAFFYPRLFLVEKFMQRINFSEPQARRFAWHSVLVVLPEFFGLLRAVPDCLGGLLRRKLGRGSKFISSRG